MAISYAADILEWSEHQADLLRRIAAGEPVNERPDWQNIIAEVDDAGRSEFRACRSLLRQALRHMLKAAAWPTWRADAVDFRRQAQDAYTPAMHQAIDLDGLYGDALAAMPDAIDGRAPLPVPGTCPVTLDELLAEGL